VGADADCVVSFECVDNLLRQFQIVELDLNRLPDVRRDGAGQKVVVHT